MSCRDCELLFEMYEGTKKSNREYWLMTELFVKLHDGKDWCDDGNGMKVESQDGLGIKAVGESK